MSRKEEIECPGYRGYDSVPFDGILAIRHPRGRARIRLAALELRLAAPDRWQLHVSRRGGPTPAPASRLFPRFAYGRAPAHLPRNRGLTC